MNEYYYFFLILLWFISKSLLIISILKNRVISLFDTFVLFSWFYVFYRPLLIDYCNVNRDLYFWDESYYIFGALYVALLLILMQVGASFIKLPSHIQFANLGLEKLKRHLRRISFFLLILSLVILVISWLEFGSMLLPFNRSGGALSVSAAGLERYFYILRITTSILIISSLFLFFVYGCKIELVYFLIGIFILLIFSKRGAILTPILVFLFLYTFYILNVKKQGFLKLLNKKTIGLMFIVLVVAFAGKVIFEPEKLLVIGGTSQSKACKIVHTGQQEFDLFNPAVMVYSYSSLNIIDLPTAIFGSVIEHENRLKNYSSRFHSATDKLMLKYNRVVYLEKKFGISPNIFQYLTFYFSFLSLFLIVIVGYVYKLLERHLLFSFYNGRVFKSYLSLILMSFLVSPHDFTFKYYAFYLVVLFFVVFIYSLYMFILRGICGEKKYSINI